MPSPNDGDISEIAMVTFIAGDRQWIRSRVGTQATEAVVSDSFCVCAVQVETPTGPVRALLPPGQDENCRMDAVPALGQHTAAILGELGFGPDAIETMRSAKAI